MWSPDGKHLAFSTGRALQHQIYVIDVDGGRARRLTSGEQNRWPAWSPAPARSLVVDSGDGTGWATGTGQWDLWILDLDTGRRGRLTSAPENDWGAAGSPDGKWLAFSAGLNRTYALTIVAADGSGRRTLTRTDSLPGER